MHRCITGSLYAQSDVGDSIAVQLAQNIAHGMSISDSIDAMEDAAGSPGCKDMHRCITGSLYAQSDVDDSIAVQLAEKIAHDMCISDSMDIMEDAAGIPRCIMSASAAETLRVRPGASLHPEGDEEIRGRASSPLVDALENGQLEAVLSENAQAARDDPGESET